MSLKNLSSVHDLVQGVGSPVNDMANQTGTPEYHTFEGTSNSPFNHNSDYPGLPSAYPKQDHLVNLLKGNWSTMDVESTRVGHGSPFTQQSGYMGNTPSKDYDLEGNDNGNGTFTQGHLAPKKINDVDLHVHLLTGTYTYAHGLSSGLVGPSPGPSGNSQFQDFQVAPGATATDFSANFDFPAVSAYNTIAGKYNQNGPSEGHY